MKKVTAFPIFLLAALSAAGCSTIDKALGFSQSAVNYLAENHCRLSPTLRFRERMLIFKATAGDSGNGTIVRVFCPGEDGYSEEREKLIARAAYRECASSNENISRCVAKHSISTEYIESKAIGECISVDDGTGTTIDYCPSTE